MTFNERMEDLNGLIAYFDALDVVNKYRIYFFDAMHHRDEMIKKDKSLLQESLNYIKPKMPKLWIMLVFLITSAIIIFLLLYLNDFSFSIYSDMSLLEIISHHLELFSSLEDKNENRSFFVFFMPGIFEICGIAWLISAIYLIFKLISYPISLVYYFHQKENARKYIKALEEKLSDKNIKKHLDKTFYDIQELKLRIENLCKKHNIDEQLCNRENIPVIKHNLEINKKLDPTIEKVCNAIISQNFVKPSIDLDTWCRLLLIYDNDFTYYQKNNQNFNPWIEKHKKKKEKFLRIVLFIPSLPIYFFSFQIKGLFAMLGFNKEDLTKPKGEKYTFNPENQYQYSEKKKELVHGSYTFVDPKGNLCESGGLFTDSRGNICEWGSPFYDGRGNLCEWGQPFYDGRGNYCEWGSTFYDWAGNLIDPNN